MNRFNQLAYDVLFVSPGFGLNPVQKRLLITVGIRNKISRFQEKYKYWLEIMGQLFRNIIQ